MGRVVIYVDCRHPDVVEVWTLSRCGGKPIRSRLHTAHWAAVTGQPVDRDAVAHGIAARWVAGRQARRGAAPA